MDEYGRITKDSIAGLTGSLLVLRGWQRQMIAEVFARDPITGRRLHRTAMLGMARKQGKSSIAAVIALEGLVLGGDGAEVYSAASDRAQAKIILTTAKKTVSLVPELSSRLKLYRDAIEDPVTGSIYKALSADAYCVAPGTLVDLPDGRRAPIGALSSGDGIIGFSGGPVFDSVGSSGVREASPCVRVVTERGREVVATEDHPFLVREKCADKTYERTTVWKVAKNLLPTDRVMVGLGWSDDYVGVPLLKDEAWALGVMTGDGYARRFRLTSTDSEVSTRFDAFLRESLESSLKAWGDGKTWEIAGNGRWRHSGGRDWVRRHFGRAVAGDKVVPDVVWTGTREDWAGFLAGYLDTDGCVPKDRPMVVWTSKSFELVVGVQALLARLGVNARVTRYSRDYTYKGVTERRPIWYVYVNGAGQVRMLADLLPVTHERKARLLHRFDDVVSERSYRLWDSDLVALVEPVGALETTALSVERTHAHVTAGLVSHNSQEGLSPTLVLADELHAWPNRDLYDVLALAMGTRVDPLMLIVTTAGVLVDSRGRQSIANSLWEYGCRVASGEVVDPTFYMAWYSAEDGCDISDERAWADANPGLGDILDRTELATAAKRAMTGGFSESEFRIKRLNQWVTASTVALPGGMFEALGIPAQIRAAAREPELQAKLAEKMTRPATEPRVIFFDGSFSRDCTALVECFLDGYLRVVDCWERPPDDDMWRVPMGEVENVLFTAVRDTNVLEVAADPFRWAKELEDWRSHDLPVLEFPTSSPQRMVPAWAAFYDGVMSGNMSHDGDVRLERHMRNMVLKVDRLGPRPVKEHRGSARSIDLGICAIGAYIRAMYYASQETSVEPLIAWGD